MEMIIKYTECVNDDNTINSFMANDILSLIINRPNIDVVEIEDIYIPKKHRRMGIGSKMVQNVIDAYAEDVIIVAAKLTKKEFRTIPNAAEKKNHLQMLNKFFMKLGFESINYWIGYEEKHAYLYTQNHIGKELFDFMNNNFIGDKHEIKN